MNNVDQASKAANAQVDQICLELRVHANDANFLLAFHALLLSGVMGIVTAQLGEQAAFELWDLVRKQGKVAMSLINVETVVKH
jgi:hypothetical protein